MAKQINVGIGGVVKKVSKAYCGIGGVVKQIKRGKCGIGGAVKEFFCVDLAELGANIGGSTSIYKYSANGSDFGDSYVEYDGEKVHIYSDNPNAYYSCLYGFVISGLSVAANTTVKCTFYSPDTDEEVTKEFMFKVSFFDTDGNFINFSGSSLSTEEKTVSGTYTKAIGSIRFAIEDNDKSTAYDGNVIITSITIDGVELIGA